MYLTCKFKLHNLSAHKRAVIRHAQEQYTDGYNALLAWARENEEILRADGQYCSPQGKCAYTAKSLSALLPRVEAEIHSSLKHSLLQDVAANLASYFELGDTAGFPIARTYSDLEIDNALEYFVATGADLHEYNAGRNYMLRRVHSAYMPLSFIRADGAEHNRNFSLLTNVDKPQLLAALWLLPNKHALAQPLNARQNNLVRTDTGEVFTSNSTTAILVPLEVGRNGWQKYKFLEPAYTGQARIKTACLLQDGDDFYLAVAFEFVEPKPYAVQAYLGIDRGILFNAAYAIVDGAGALMEMGHLEDDLRALQIKHGQERECKARNGKIITKRDYKTRAYDQILHTLANRLLDMAEAHQAMIVLENLNVQVKGRWVRSRFKKLENFLRYKGKLRGVPVRNVFAAYSSQICHVCGGDMLRNDREVVCMECDYRGHSDDNAAVNIARRALYKKANWPGGYRQFHRSFCDRTKLTYQISFLSQS